MLLLLVEDVQFVCSWHRVRSRRGRRGRWGCWCNCRCRRGRRLSWGDGWNRWNSSSIPTTNDDGCSLLMLYRRGGCSTSGVLGVPKTAVSIVRFRSLLLMLMMLLWLRRWRSYMRLLTRSWLLSTWGRRRYEVSLGPNRTGQNDYWNKEMIERGDEKEYKTRLNLENMLLRLEEKEWTCKIMCIQREYTDTWMYSQGTRNEETTTHISLILSCTHSHSPRLHEWDRTEERETDKEKICLEDLWMYTDCEKW